MQKQFCVTQAGKKLPAPVHRIKSLATGCCRSMAGSMRFPLVQSLFEKNPAGIPK